MTGSQTTTDSSPLLTTRQMLDELDALMERMLALPVNDADDAPPLPALPTRGPALAASLTLLDPPAVEPEAAPEAAPPAPPTSVAAGPPRAESLAPPLPAPVTLTPLPPTVLPEIRPLLDAVPRHAPTAATWGLLPLIWLNEAADLLLAPLGRPGRWLTSPGGRMFLGALGLAFWALAAGWLAVDGQGWSR